MNLQTIKSMDGKVEYVLLPVETFNALRVEIIQQLKQSCGDDDYEEFDPADYVDNPVALARIKAHLTQGELARLMGVTQAYISKIENQDRVSAKILEKVRCALGKRGSVSF